MVSSDELLRQAYDIINKSPVVAFLWRNREGWPVEFVSENVERLFGYESKEFLFRQVSYAQAVHPEDLDRVTQEVEEYGREPNRLSFSHQPYRIVTKSGQIKWVSDKTYIKRDENGNITHFQGIVEDITELKSCEEEREKLIQDLQSALAQVKRLSGLLPICACCKKIRDDQGSWKRLEEYISKHSEAEFSHGICPDCRKKLYPELFD